MGYELRVVSDARTLYFRVHQITQYNTDLKFTLNQQIIRASISVGSNVVEGSRRTPKEFRRYLDIAIGSCDEVKYQLSLYPQSDLTKHTLRFCDRIIGQLVNLKNSIK